MRRWLIFICLGLVACAAPPVTPTSTIEISEPVRYYPQTGHTLREPFLSYFDAHDGQENFGYPITEAINHEGWQVQYYQFARLEFHPENDPAYVVTVGWLGDLLHRRRPPLPEQSIPPAHASGRRYFPETGHTIADLFLAYFDANGDTVRFGRPISEPFLQNGLIVQDFQGARLIWRPDLPAGQQVQLAPIGETYFLAGELSLDLLGPAPAPAGAQIARRDEGTVTAALTARLRVEPTPRPGIFRVLAYVQADGRPVADVSTVLVIETAGQQPGLDRPLPPTRSSGESHILLDLSAEESGTQINLFLFDKGQTVLLGRSDVRY